DHVHALPSQVARLVEAVFIWSRPLDLHDNAEERSLGGCPAGREVEPCALSGRLVAEPQDPHGHPHLEGAAPSRAGDFAESRAGAPDLRGQLAAIESVEAQASPPPPG